MTCYVVVATGIIVGLVGADPAYMGGFSMIVILMAFLPFQRGHALALIFASGVIFLIAAFFTSVDLEPASKQYGLLNLILTFVMSVAIVFLIDYTRKTSFERGLLIRRRNKEIEKQKIELEEAMTKLKTLGGLLPICANCKSIRDSKGYWHQLERYIGDHSEAEFSHSLCEDCVKKLYPDLADHLKI
ncbi:MAG: hypothetical protein GY757_16000 [bacterium]|nr:hypothetical protein [bacterium]